jgi:hypothetical protein
MTLIDSQKGEEKAQSCENACFRQLTIRGKPKRFCVSCQSSITILMASIESLIVGSEKLTTIFGYWPSFHDAEALELHFWRGNIETEKGIYDFPFLTLTIHLWEYTKDVNPQGFLVLRHHTLATLRFYDVDDFQMEGFNHQNAIMGLAVRSEQRTEGPSPYFSVEVEPAFGMAASFNCLRVEVLDAVPCSDEGKALPRNLPNW